MVERTNRTIINRLRTSCSKALGQWGERLPLLLFAYRTTRHKTTEFSPFELMFGRTATHWNTVAEQMEQEGYTPEAHHDDLAARLTEYRELVEAHAAMSTEETLRRREPEVRDYSYNVGDAVWLRENAPRHKLAPRWIGGWRIDVVLGPVTLRIVNDAGHTKVVHVDKIKPRLIRSCNSPSQTLTGTEEHTQMHHTPAWFSSEQTFDATNNTADVNPPESGEVLDTGQAPRAEQTIEFDLPSDHTDSRPERERRLPARLGDYVLYSP